MTPNVKNSTTKTTTKISNLMNVPFCIFLIIKHLSSQVLQNPFTTNTIQSVTNNAYQNCVKQ